jgi:RimJ/RimL family protein N-acetyltransferase
LLWTSLSREASGMVSPIAVPHAPPTLTDSVVTLRGHRRADIPAIVRQGQDPEMIRWTRVPVPYAPRDAEDYFTAAAAGWARSSGYAFAIEVSGEYAGAVDLRPQGPGAAEVGYALGPWARGRGIMSRALRLVVGWGFDTLGLDVVLWQAQVGNWASRRVAWSVGFRVEGTVRGLLLHREARADAWIGSLRREDERAPEHAWLQPPVLLGDRVTLRPHRDADIPRIVEACRDATTRHWLSTLPTPYTAADAREHLLQIRTQQASGTGLYWAVTPEDEDVLVGEMGIFVRDDAGRQGEIGYWTHPRARGRGLTTAAARLAARHALLPREDGGLGMERLLLRAAAGNHASQRVAENAGFRRSGVDRAADPLGDGSLDDDVRFDLLPDELPPAGSQKPGLPAARRGRGRG